MSATQPDILRLADAYADASFDQGLNQRTEDPAPELARGALSAGVGVLYAQRSELLAALKLVTDRIEFCTSREEMQRHMPTIEHARAVIAKAHAAINATAVAEAWGLS